MGLRTACRYLLTAATLLAFAGGSISAHPGVGIVRDSRGNIFYTDLKHVWKISPAGERSIAVRNVHTHELFVDSTDNLYGEHLWYEGDATKLWGHRVWRRSPAGVVTDVIPARRGFRDDHDEFHFVQDSRGRMYWADRGTTTAIRRRNPGAGVTVLAEGLRAVGWLTVTPRGFVYFVEEGDLRRITPDGTLSTVARDLNERGLSEFLMEAGHNIMGLWTDSAGNVFLACLGGRMVKRVDPRGTVAVVIRSEAPWGPTGGLSTPNDDLWLLETSDDNRVRVRHLRGDEVIAVYP
jgi:hypothetical protein